MRKTDNIIIRVDEDIKREFQSLAEKNGMTVSSILNACMVDMISRNIIPMNIKRRLCALKLKEKEPELTVVKLKQLLVDVIKEAKLENKIDKVYLFGSYSRGEETEESDIDFRIEQTDDFDLFDLSEMSFLLKQKTGKNIDIATLAVSKMDPDFYASIKKDEICLYERT